MIDAPALPWEEIELVGGILDGKIIAIPLDSKEHLVPFVKHEPHWLSVVEESLLAHPMIINYYVYCRRGKSIYFDLKEMRENP